MQELTQILQTVEKIGGYAYLLFILYLAKQLITTGAVLTFFYFALKRLFVMLGDLTTLSQFASLADITSPLSASEKQELKRIFIKGLQKD